METAPWASLFNEMLFSMRKSARSTVRCTCPTQTHRMSCGAGARPVVVARKGCGLHRCDPFACNDCMDCANFEGLPGHLYNESCPGTCCGGNEEL